MATESVFFVVAVLICALNTKQLQCETALFGKKKWLWHLIVFKSQSYCGTIGVIMSYFNSISALRHYTLARCVCVCIFFVHSVLHWADTWKGDSHTGCPGPALFNVFTNASTDCGRESTLVKYCLWYQVKKDCRISKVESRNQNALDPLEELCEINKKKFRKGKSTGERVISDANTQCGKTG